ncbi:MAG: GDSL-type esterase/lipase family protein [Oscillospiraceae bacterium]|nr:GDSL-type esterase/lipase family protein [Oscillospiraceae bacterium]
MIKTVKKLLSVLLCALMLLIPLGIASKAADEPIVAEAPLKYTVLGDSIAEGVGSKNKKTDGFSAIVAETKGYDLNNLALGGIPSEILMKWVLEKENVRDGIAEADIISVSIGGNDFLLSGIFSMVINALLKDDYTVVDGIIAVFKENFEVIIGEIRGLNEGAMLIVQTLYNPMESILVIGEVYDKAVSSLNECYYGYLEDNPGAYLIADVYGALKGRDGMICPDLVHPSNKGHAMIAQVVMDAIDGTETELPPPEEVALSTFQRFFQNVITFIKCAFYWAMAMPGYIIEYGPIYSQM